MFYIPSGDFHDDTAYDVELRRAAGTEGGGNGRWLRQLRGYPRHEHLPQPQHQRAGSGARQLATRTETVLCCIAPNVTAINERDGDGKSRDHVLHPKGEKRFSHGLQMLVSYTFSKHR